MIKMLSLSLTLPLLVAVAGCKHNNGSMDSTDRSMIGDTSMNSSAAPAGQMYTCTMDPDVVSDKPGKCPKCGMALVPKK